MFRRAAPAVAAAVLAAACAAPSGTPSSTDAGSIPATTAPAGATTTTTAPAVPALPDVSARALTVADLEQMLPDGSDGISERTNGALVSGTAEHDDEQADIDRYGRLAGVAATYPGDGGETHVWIDLTGDAAGAEGYLADAVGDIAKGIGGTHDPASVPTTAASFPVDGVGDDAYGIEATLGDGSSETIVMFRLGRLVVFVSATGPGDQDRRVPVLYLAQEIQTRVTDVLVAGEATTDATAGPDSYRFASTLQATVDGERRAVSAGGVVDGDAVSCRVRMDDVDGTIDRDLVFVGHLLWARDHGTGDYEAAAGGDVADRALLAYCPAWPADATAAGLSDLIDGDPAEYTLDGIDVLGYGGGDADLAGLLGVEPGEVAADVFTFWVADGVPWLMDLRIEASGTGASLGALIGSRIPPDALVSVSISQQLSDVGDAGSVRPPGLP